LKIEIEKRQGFSILNSQFFILSKLRRLPPLSGLKVAALPRAVAKLRWHHEKVPLVRATSGSLFS
jgi:hypothetical protein